MILGHGILAGVLVLIRLDMNPCTKYGVDISLCTRTRLDLGGGVLWKREISNYLICKL